MSATTYEEFTRLVHNALNRLYDSPYLHSHPLVEMLIAPQQRSIQPSQEVRRILLQAIHAMRPPQGTPAQSPDWRAYRILELRFLEGMTPAQAMEHLALSRSQFFRDQARIIEALAQCLWQRRVPAPDTTADPQSRSAIADSEVLRLSGDADWEPIDVIQMLKSLAALLDPLARSKGASIRFDLSRPIDDLPGDRVMLRQALLTALTYAIYRAPGGTVRVDTFCTPATAGLDIAALVGQNYQTKSLGPEHKQGVGLYIGRELMAALHGSLTITTDIPGQWAARLAWAYTRSTPSHHSGHHDPNRGSASPILLVPTLLVVDDNQTFAHLCRRYLSAYPWQVLSAANTHEARRLATAARPSIILLDIMMPKEDGWELLAWLKADPHLRDIPVVVCSVLNEPDLAAMLGAAAHLTKPLSQAQLLQTLARLAKLDASPEPTP